MFSEISFCALGALLIFAATEPCQPLYESLILRKVKQTRNDRCKEGIIRRLRNSVMEILWEFIFGVGRKTNILQTKTSKNLKNRKILFPKRFLKLFLELLLHSGDSMTVTSINVTKSVVGTYNQPRHPVFHLRNWSAISTMTFLPLLRKK